MTFGIWGDSVQLGPARPGPVLRAPHVCDRRFDICKGGVLDICAVVVGGRSKVEKCMLVVCLWLPGGHSLCVVRMPLCIAGASDYGDYGAYHISALLVYLILSIGLGVWEGRMFCALYAFFCVPFICFHGLIVLSPYGMVVLGALLSLWYRTV